MFTNLGDDGGYATFVKRGNQPNTFGVALQKAGYRTGFMGKYLNGYQPTKNNPDPGWNEWDVAGEAYAEFDYRLNENGTVHQYGRNTSDYLTDVLSRKAVSFVDQSASSGKPFMLEVATFAPHLPSVPAPRNKGSFPHLTAPRTPAYGQQPSNAPAWLKTIPPLTSADDQNIDGEFRRRGRSVQAIDDMVGRLEQELKAKGLAKNTYFVFSSDNGYHMGEHRLRPGKQTAFDTDIRVPLMVTGPGVPAGKQVTQLTSGIDLAPTCEELGGTGVPPTVDGASLVSLWHGQTPRTWQRAILIEHHGPPRSTTAKDPDAAARVTGKPPSYEAIRTASELYVQYTDGEREQYNTTTDPNELHNLAGLGSQAQSAPLQRALTALVNCHNTVSCQAAAQLK